MTQEDRLQHLLNIDDPQTEQEDNEFKKLFNSIAQDLKLLELLKKYYYASIFDNTLFICPSENYDDGDCENSISINIEETDIKTLKECIK